MSSELSSGKRTPGSTTQTQLLDSLLKYLGIKCAQARSNQVHKSTTAILTALPLSFSISQPLKIHGFQKSILCNSPNEITHQHTWREDIWVEADIESSVADGAHCFTGIQDHFTAFGICLGLEQHVGDGIWKKHTNLKGMSTDRSCQNVYVF